MNDTLHQGISLLQSEWGDDCTLICPAEMHSHMALIKLPPRLQLVTPTTIQDTLHFQHKIEVPVKSM